MKTPEGSCWNPDEVLSSETNRTGIFRNYIFSYKSQEIPRRTDSQSCQIPAGLQTSSSKPQGKELEPLSSPLLCKKTNWTLLVRISSLNWPSVFTVNVAKNGKCQGCQQSQQNTVSEETRICIFLIFFNWAPWTCIHTALRFYPVLYQSLMNYSVDQMKLTK